MNGQSDRDVTNTYGDKPSIAERICLKPKLMEIAGKIHRYPIYGQSDRDVTNTHGEKTTIAEHNCYICYPYPFWKLYFDFLPLSVLPTKKKVSE